MPNKLFILSKLDLYARVRILPLKPRIITQHVWHQDGCVNYKLCTSPNYCENCFRGPGNPPQTDMFFAVIDQEHPDKGVWLLSVDKFLYDRIMGEDRVRTLKGKPIWEKAKGLWRILMGDQPSYSVMDVHRGCDFHLETYSKGGWYLPNCKFYEQPSFLGTPEQIKQWMEQGEKMLFFAEPTRNFVATKPAFGCVKQTAGRIERMATDEAHRTVDELLTGFTRIAEALSKTPVIPC